MLLSLFHTGLEVIGCPGPFCGAWRSMNTVSISWDSGSRFHGMNLSCLPVTYRKMTPWKYIDKALGVGYWMKHPKMFVEFLFRHFQYFCFTVSEKPKARYACCTRKDSGVRSRIQRRLRRVLLPDVVRTLHGGCRRYTFSGNSTRDLLFLTHRKKWNEIIIISSANSPMKWHIVILTIAPRILMVGDDDMAIRKREG